MLAALCFSPFEPLAQVDLKWLSMKVAFLLAVVSAKHVGELHALSMSGRCLRWAPDDSGVTLWPNVAFLPKVLAATYVNQPIRLARFDMPAEEGGSSLLCPVRALRAYIGATAVFARFYRINVAAPSPMGAVLQSESFALGS